LDDGRCEELHLLPWHYRSGLIDDCEENPVFCPTFLRGAGYDPLDPGDVGDTGAGSVGNPGTGVTAQPGSTTTTITTTTITDTNPTVTTEPGTPDATATSTGERVAVIGENMPDRVYPFARELEAQGIHVETFSPTQGTSTSEALDENGQWVRSMRDQGVPILDIGPDPSRPFVSKSDQPLLCKRTPRSRGVLELLARVEALMMSGRSVKNKTGETTSLQSYVKWAQEIAPRVLAALSGKVEVPEQRPSTEAWLTYALYWKDSQLSLEDMIRYADVVGHSIPNALEISWALLRLRKRGWLSIQKDSYGLTDEGRRAVGGIVGSGDLRKRIERLEEWTSAHPPPMQGDRK
jgi:hypothetical protein